MMALASSAPFDFYPFNLPSGGPFLGFYSLVIFFTLLIIVAIRSLLPRLLQRPEPPQHQLAADSPAGGDSPYRVAGRSAAPAHQPLTLGFLPRSDELHAIAFLKEGSRGVANLLIAQALAAGYLRPDDDGEKTSTERFVFVDTPPPSEPLARAFYDEIKARQSLEKAGLQELAERSAAASAPTLEAQLERAGLVASDRAKRATTAVAVLVVLVALAIGGMRMIRLLVLHRYVAFLTAQMIFLGVVGLILALRRLKAPRGKAYLSWLEDATYSLRTDVATGRRDGARDVGLALAVGGLSAVVAAPLLSPLGGVFIMPPVVASVSSGSSCGSSSCGSSSCGGGSGCGGGGGCGGGCGGGGGCG